MSMLCPCDITGCSVDTKEQCYNNSSILLKYIFISAYAYNTKDNIVQYKMIKAEEVLFN